MNDIEQQLRSALARKDPDPGFAGRVLEGRENRWRPTRWIGVAATVAMAWAGSVSYQHYQERSAGERAALALRITADKLNQTRARVLGNLRGEQQ